MIKNKSIIYKRMLVTYITAVIVLIFLLNSAFIFFMKGEVVEQRYDINKKLGEEIHNEITSYTNSVDTMINNIYTDNAILYDILEFLNLEEKEYLKYKLDKFSNSNSYYHKGVEWFVNLSFNTYDSIHAMTFISKDKKVCSSFNNKNQIKTVDMSDLEGLYYGAHVILGKENMSYIREINNPVTLEKEGVMVITFDFKNIDRIVKSYGKEYSSLIVDADGALIYFSEANGEELDNISATELLTGYYYDKFKDSSGRIIYSRTKEASLMDIRPEYYIYLLLVNFSVFLIAGMFIYVKLTRFNDRIEKITKAMDSVKEGNFLIKIDKGNEKDELAYISENFNEMCVKLDKYINKSLKAELRQKEAEMRELQSQINPHFLYNTLEAIRMKAICNGEREIGRMLFLLADLFRNQLKEDDIITMQNEIDYCKKYLELFRFRYQEKFEYNIYCEEQVKDKKINKFLIQPIIENYLIHGIERERNDNKLFIRIENKDKEIIITVNDNGKGIAKDKIIELNKKLRNRDTSGKSVGISNVNERVVMTYGEDYGVIIDEDVTCGTCIFINLPSVD